MNTKQESIHTEWKATTATGRDLLAQCIEALRGQYITEDIDVMQRAEKEHGPGSGNVPQVIEERAELKRKYQTAVLALIEDYHREFFAVVDFYSKQLVAAGSATSTVRDPIQDTEVISKRSQSPDERSVRDAHRATEDLAQAISAEARRLYH